MPEAAFPCIGKRRLVDETLVFLEARDMRVTEDGKTVRPHADGRFDRLDAGFDGLKRQPVDQVEVDRVDVVMAKMLHRIHRRLDALDAVDRLLDRRVEALDA
jgi:hypothetical protein